LNWLNFVGVCCCWTETGGGGGGTFFIAATEANVFAFSCAGSCDGLALNVAPDGLLSKDGQLNVVLAGTGTEGASAFATTCAALATCEDGIKTRGPCF
jgi:hypothetical protein